MNIAFVGTKKLTKIMRKNLKKLCISLAMFPEQNVFLVGNETEFDKDMASLLQEIFEEYYYIDYAIVSVSKPQEEPINERIWYMEELKDIPHELAVLERTKWMTEKVDTICYSAAKGDKMTEEFIERAEEAGKIVLKVDDMTIPSFKDLKPYSNAASFLNGTNETSA